MESYNITQALWMRNTTLLKHITVEEADFLKSTPSVRPWPLVLPHCCGVILRACYSV